MKLQLGPEIIKALLAVQKELAFANKDGENPHFHSTYPTLESALTTYMPLLNKNGMAVSQCYDMDATGKPSLVTILMHESGEYISGDQPLIPQKATPQSIAAATTYASRIGLLAIVCGGGKDDDGEEAESRHRHPGKLPPIGNQPAITMPQKMDQKEFERITGAKPHPGMFLLKFGKFSGKKIVDIPLEQLKSYREYLISSARDSGEELSSHAQDFVNASGEYINQNG